MSGLIDRFWLWSLAEPVVVGAFMVVLALIIVGGWWVGWRGKNHLVGAALIGGLAWLWRGVYDALRKRNTRPRE